MMMMMMKQQQEQQQQQQQQSRQGREEMMMPMMMMGATTIVWFRRDLRVEDNPALAAAARLGMVIPLFIWAAEEEGQFLPGRVSRWWMKQSLAHLQQSLSSLGAPLVLRRSRDALSVLLQLARDSCASRVFYNHLYG
jgi:cryptochrome 1